MSTLSKPWRWGMAAALATGIAAGLLWRHLSKVKKDIVVSELWVFPVKGCKGISLREAVIGHYGVEHDREWYLVKASDGAIQKQGNVPRLALVHVNLDLLRETLTLSAEGYGSIELSTKVAEGPIIEFDIWDMKGGCVDQGDEAAAWFSRVTGADLRLRRIVRPRDCRTNPDMPVLPDQDAPMLGQDETPLMIMGDGTVKQIRDECGDNSVDVCRFRPNVLLSNVPPREEDQYRTLKIGEVDMLVGRLCTRCSVPAVRPDGTFHPRFEPTKTLKKRYSVSTAEGAAARPVAGLSVFHLNKGVIRVGDRVTVTSTISHPYVYGAAAQA